jgi:hypothetical protein
LSVAVVVPQYNPKLTTGEAISVRHLHRHLGSYDRFVVAPESLAKTLPGFEVIRFPDHFFTSAGAFAILQLRARFYWAFAAHEHVLMVQLDPLVLSNRLLEFSSGSYDYVGAPWLERAAVGNGGFSLRHIPAFLRVLESKRYLLGGPDRSWRDRAEVARHGSLPPRSVPAREERMCRCAGRTPAVSSQSAPNISVTWPRIPVHP